MKLLGLTLLAGTFAICSATNVYAHDTFSFGLNIGGPLYAPPPAAYYPAPPAVYYSTPPTIYYSPAPRIYYESYYPPSYFRSYGDDNRHHDWGHRPGHGHRDGGHHRGWR